MGYKNYTITHQTSSMRDDEFKYVPWLDLSPSLLIVLFLLIIVCFIYINTTPSMAYNAKNGLEGYTLEPKEKWTSGVIKGWSEGDCVPFRHSLRNNHKSFQLMHITWTFDHERDDLLGIIAFEDIQVPSGTVIGPYFDNRGNGFYDWIVIVPGGTTYVSSWCARLGKDSSLWPGASMHVGVEGGGDVPIKVSASLPSCGIGGPTGVCENQPIEMFYYIGEETYVANFSFIWWVDDVEVGRGEEIDIDWSQFEFGDHILELQVTKASPNGAVTENSCQFAVKYVESPNVSIVVGK